MYCRKSSHKDLTKIDSVVGEYALYKLEKLDPHVVCATSSAGQTSDDKVTDKLPHRL